MNCPQPVRLWSEQVVLPTYLPAPPDKNPMFLERRIYQGSSGAVYPLPFTDRIAETKVDRAWQAVWLENEFLRVLLLPELGGRIHRVVDKTSGCDLVYYQPTIKPALVGLAGPWISGGIELNWPQHHRPATFLPVDVQFASHADGSQTAWCGDRDPLTRMQAAHGVCLHPGRSALELKVRVTNRTPWTQTFLWWANVAVRVHECYQSFFPPDVTYVADHARRSTSSFPLANGVYYGVNFGRRRRAGVPADERPPQYVPPRDSGGAATLAYAPHDLSFYANIPTPCSYMALGSQGDFFGGYDHRAQVGLVHVASHHIAPGKKQWTWGNHPFGYAWDRNLTDPDAAGEHAPYIELMAGVYTDNQPDFSFLAPGETRTWSQFWYPIHRIGPVQAANVDAAVRLDANGRVRVGVCASARFPQAVVCLERKQTRLEWTADLAPGEPFTVEVPADGNQPWRATECTLSVLDGQGRQIITYSPQPPSEGAVPPPAIEPAPPEKIASADELYVTGLHLWQYRHATCCPTLYWREALRRDPLDGRCNNALGQWHLRRGEFAVAEEHFRAAIARLTCRNANPADGEPFYNLGLALRYMGRDEAAYDAFYKAAWNAAWAGPAYLALAEIACTRGDWSTALEHLDRAATYHPASSHVRNLRRMVARRQGSEGAAAAPSGPNLAGGPPDWWARFLDGQPPACDLQTCLDIARDMARAGFYVEAIELLETRIRSWSAESAPVGQPTPAAAELPNQSWGALPLVHYTLGWLHERRGDAQSALAVYRRAAAAAPDYCFPARLEEIAVLEAAMRANPGDARAPYYLGNLLYDRRRQREAIGYWERSARLDPAFSIVWRNLGIGYFNVRGAARAARTAYNRAFRAHPRDARLLYERDQLWKRTGQSPARRLRELERHLDLVRQRDDLSVELCALFNQSGRHEAARQWLASRRFQPWEGGEGLALAQHVRTHLALGREAFAAGEFAAAREHFARARQSPENLGEARHLLANESDVLYWLGCACAALGERRAARGHWRAAATFRGDFQEMSVRAYSEMTYYSALAWEKLGRPERAKKLLRELLAHARELAQAPAQTDYFATSLPTMLLFADDLAARQQTTALFLEAQARLGLRQRARARSLLGTVLRRDPNHPLAGDLLAEVKP